MTKQITGHKRDVLQLSSLASKAGTYAEMSVAAETAGSQCSKCGREIPIIRSPFQISRIYDRFNSNEGPIADFLFMGRFQVVSAAAKQIITEMDVSARFEAVEVVENEERKKQFRRTPVQFKAELARDRAVVLWRLVIATVYELDLQLSGRAIHQQCSQCGFARAEIVRPGTDIVVTASTVPSKDIFHVKCLGESLTGAAEFFGPVFLTLNAANTISTSGLTNAGIRRVGHFA